MKRSFTYLLLALLLSSTLAFADEGKIFPYEAHSETLDNGLNVILVPMTSGGLMAYWTIARVGARDEYEPNRTGFAHFFEHMMFRGTEKYPSKAYEEAITKIGADTNAYTTDDLTAYYLNIASEDLEKVMELESDRFRNLAYPEEMFKTEAGAVYGEYRKNRTNPFFVIREELQQTAFKKHTYGHTAMGYPEDIQLMPTLFDYSKTFFDRYYRPDNVILVIVGDLQVEPTMEMVRRYYGEWEAGYVPPKITPEPPQTGERRVDVPYDGNSLPIFWIGYKSPAFDPTDVNQMAGHVLCDLAFGETSPIYKKLVLDEQVVEFMFADMGINRDPGLLSIYGRIKDPSKVDYVIEEIDRVIADLQTQPPQESQLKDLQSRLKYDFLMSLDTPSNVAGNLARWIAVTGGIEVVESLFSSYEKVRPEDVQKAAQEYLVQDRRTIAVLKGAN